MEREMALNFLRQLGGAAGAGPRGTGPVGAGVGGPMGTGPVGAGAPMGRRRERRRGGCRELPAAAR